MSLLFGAESRSKGLSFLTAAIINSLLFCGFFFVYHSSFAYTYLALSGEFFLLSFAESLSTQHRIIANSIRAVIYVALITQVIGLLLLVLL